MRTLLFWHVTCKYEREIKFDAVALSTYSLLKPCHFELLGQSRAIVRNLVTHFMISVYPYWLRSEKLTVSSYPMFVFMLELSNTVIAHIIYALVIYIVFTVKVDKFLMNIQYCKRRTNDIHDMLNILLKLLITIRYSLHVYFDNLYLVWSHVICRRLLRASLIQRRYCTAVTNVHVHFHNWWALCCSV